MADNSRSGRPNYLYNLPILPWSNLCRILNEINKWEKLAGLMGYDDDRRIEVFRRTKDPADALLQHWSHSNHTVEALFSLLSKMQNYESMLVLQPYVEEKYHCLIYKGERMLSRAHRHASENSNVKEIEIRPGNFNRDRPAKKNCEQVVASNGDMERKNYVGDLQYTARCKLSKILNENDKWKILAGHMRYGNQIIDRLRKTRDPTDELLEIWSHQNPSIEELFALLSKMDNYESMLVLQPYVDEKYHKLIYEGERNFARLYHLELGNQDSEEVVWPLEPRSENFNEVQPAKISEKKLPLAIQCTNLSVVKILNCVPQLTKDIIPGVFNNI